MSDTPPEQGAPRSGFTLDLSSGTAGKGKRPKGFVPVVQQTINLTTKKAAPDAPPTAAPPQDVPAQPEPTRAATNQAQTKRAEPKRADAKRADAKRADAKRADARRTDARGERRPSGGTSLADLLDEATLARLRGQ